MKNKKTILCFFPTHTKDDAFKYILNGLEYLKSLTDNFIVQFGIVGQGDFDHSCADKARAILESLGIELLFEYQEIENPVKFFSLRQKCAYLNKSADYYLILDHNMQFSEGTGQYPKNSGQRYLQALEYMEVNPECGIVNCCGSLGGSIEGERIRLLGVQCGSTWGKPIKKYNAGRHISLQKGDIYRNFSNGQIYPPECLDFLGAFDELIYSIWANENGYYVAKQFNNPTKHHDVKKIIVMNSRFCNSNPITIEKQIDLDNGLHLFSNAKKYAFEWITKNITKKEYKYHKHRIINIGWKQDGNEIFKTEKMGKFL